MRNKAAKLLGLACLALALKGDSCLVEKRESDFVVRADIPAVWHTQGSNSSGTDMQTVSAADEVENALNSLSEDSEVTSINISGVCYEVLENNGFVGAHSGNVTVEPASGGTAMPLLSFSAPSNATGVTGSSEGAQVSLMSAGVNFINGRLNQYLTTKDASLLDVKFVAHWTSSDPTGDEEYDFNWKTCLILQVTGTLTVDVFDP